MKHSVPDIADQTINFWRRRVGKKFSPDDAKEAIVNISGFLEVLSDWDRKDHENASSPIRDSMTEENL